MATATEKAWFLTHITLPMVPFVLAGVIRLLMHKFAASMETFSTAELAICLALLCLCVNQSLARHPRLLDNEDKLAEAQSEALVFLLLSIILVAAFALVVLLDVLVFELNYRDGLVALRFIQSTILAVMPWVLHRASRAQQSFDLKGGLWIQ
ncbi:hypothetical protein ACFLS5_03005 [Candidatus Bipolaricaulota bacterium]